MHKARTRYERGRGLAPDVSEPNGASSPAIERSTEWQRLQAHFEALRGKTLRELFNEDPQRGQQMALQCVDIYLDYSKNLVTSQTIDLLCDLAKRAQLDERIEQMFAGATLNVSENRPALHVALRAALGEAIIVDGKDVVAETHATLDRMAKFAEEVRSGAWRGYTDKSLTTVVNIGIGGSHLGPAMVYQALTPYATPPPAVRFVSNVDGADLWDALHDADAERTLFIVSSKSFVTPETRTNAMTARRWLTDKLGDDRAVERHFVAVSNNVGAAEQFGIRPDQVFEMPEWVGGRYSYDSPVGLSLMLGLGPECFYEILRGARAVDQHFRTAPFSENVPALLGLIGVWYINFFGAEAHAVLPYSHYLSKFPAHLQQLDMESNGKSVDREGRPVLIPTAPVIWGQPGTNGQHAFYQLLHQGTRFIPADFIGFARPSRAVGDHHTQLMANFFSQTAALAFGKTSSEVSAAGVPDKQVPHRTFPGNRPTNTILASELTPFVLGQLITLYEHKVFTQGAIWNVNSFDQWGVELGKSVAKQVLPQLEQRDGVHSALDTSTEALIRRYLDLQ